MEGLPQNCSDVQASLPLYVGADLEAPAMDAVSAHLAACSVCSALHERGRAARSALRELRRHQGRPASSVSLWVSVRERLLAEGLLAPRGESIPAARAWPTSVASGPRPVAPSWRLWGGVAAAAAILLFCILVFRSNETPELGTAPDRGAPPIADVPAAATQSTDALVVPVVDLASSDDEAWTRGIHPLRPAGPEDPSLFDRALSGEGPRVLDPSASGEVRTVNRFWDQRLR